MEARNAGNLIDLDRALNHVGLNAITYIHSYELCGFARILRNKFLFMGIGGVPAVLNVLACSVCSLCSPCSRVMVKEEGANGIHLAAVLVVLLPIKKSEKAANIVRVTYEAAASCARKRTSLLITMLSLPITDTVVHAFAQLVDDSGNNGSYREPSHSDIEFQVNTSGLAAFDPKQQGQQIGKAKRVRAVLYEAMSANPGGGSKFAIGLLGKIRACGGFRAGAPNFVGHDAITNAKLACDSVGFVLADDGSISPKVLTTLHGPELTAALLGYARRAQRGAEDAALVAGTGKDLLEATAAHVLMTIRGSYPSGANFQALLGMAFMALDLAVPEIPEVKGESPIRSLERGLFTTALGVNRVRNKQGSGHGRPWLTTLTDAEAKAAIESVGTVANYLLAKLATHGR